MAPFHHTLPALSTALTDPEDWVSENATLVLQAMGPDASDLVPDLIRELQNPKRGCELRATIARALCRIGPASPVVINALMSAIRSPDRIVQCAAVVALGGGGDPGEAETALRLRQNDCPAMKDAVALLRKIWNGDDHLLGYLAHKSLRNIDPERMKDARSPEPLKPPGQSNQSGVTYFRYVVGATDDYSLFVLFTSYPYLGGRE